MGNVLAQLAPGATTLTDLYRVGAANQADIDAIIVCNRGADATFRVSIAILQAANAVSQYLYYDAPLLANSTFLLDVAGDAGLTLKGGDTIRCYASSANFTFQVFGTEGVPT